MQRPRNLKEELEEADRVSETKELQETGGDVAAIER